MAKFKAGTSGNPNGRPKGALSRRTLLKQAIQRHAKINGKAGEIDVIVKLVKSDDKKVSNDALQTIGQWLRGGL